MKLHADTLQGLNAISRHSAEGVIVNNQTWRRSIIVPWQGQVLPWAPETVDGITGADVDQLVALKPELVIFGSGPQLRFAKPVVWKALMANGIGFETMDTPAACRTYNVLLAEGRAVVSAMLFSAS